MKKWKKRKIYLTLLCLVFGLFLIGCQKKHKNQDSLVVTVNKNKIFLDEVMYYIWQMEEECSYYEDYYQKNYQMDFWEQDAGDGLTTRDMIKEDIINGVIRTNLLWEKAAEEGYKLSKEEKETLEKEAKNIWEAFSEEQKQTMGLTEQKLTEILQREELVNRFFEDTTAQYKIEEEKIKEDVEKQNLREFEIETISIPIIHTEEGEEKPYDKEEKNSAYETLEELYHKAKEEKNWDTLVEDDQSDFIYETYGFTMNDGVCEEAIQEAASKLSNGQISSIVETDDAFVIIKMLNNNSSAAYEEALDNALSSAKYKEFDAYYEELKKKAKIEINQTVWDSVIIGNTTLNKDEKKDFSPAEATD